MHEGQFTQMYNAIHHLILYNNTKIYNNNNNKENFSCAQACIQFKSPKLNKNKGDYLRNTAKS